MAIIINHLGARGDGVGSDEAGTPYYFPFTAPGDEISLDGDILKHGPHHRDPECQHFGTCGGCALQHIDEALYRGWLKERLAQALSQHGISTEIREPHISAVGGRRRAALQARWQGGKIHLGYSKPRSHDVIDLEACPVLDPRLFKLIGPLRALLKKTLVHNAAARIEMTLAVTGIDLLIEAPLDMDDAMLRHDLSQFAEAQHLCRLAIKQTDGLIDVVVQRRLPFVRFGDVPVVLPVGAFLQATTDGERALVDTVVDAAKGSHNILDLFSGVGTFSFPLSVIAKTHAVEGWRDALDAMVQAGATQKGMSVEHRDLFRRPMTVKELKGYDTVVFDPPRAGAKAQAPLLAESSIKRIIAVSCNPNTFARDAENILAGGYQLNWVKPIGQFLWSREVELAALFTR
ncbi:MAG: class I SAM-dependent RNA methyltransferase [Sphingomonadales bacterium]|jgi:23S rRNA (uracil1939-C5)-methyltransferase